LVVARGLATFSGKLISALLVYIIAGVLHLAPPLTELNRALEDSISDFGRFSSRISKPLAGEEALPSHIRAMLALLRKNGIQTYDISEKLSNDPLDPMLAT